MHWTRKLHSAHRKLKVWGSDPTAAPQSQAMKCLG